MKYSKALSNQRVSKRFSFIKEESIFRIFDVFFSLLIIILLSPIIIFFSLLIKIKEPKGSVFFRQTRVGLRGETFKIYKFRTMCEGAEQQLTTLAHQNEMSGPLFKMKDDPRITKVGKFLRKYSLDELPQLINVIKGDMSLVGPRPPLVSEYLTYTTKDKKRLTVKPGCTGLWQVGNRNQATFQEMLELDVLYISNRSIWLNLKILVKTVARMTIDANGY